MEGILKIIVESGGVPALLIFGVGFILYRFLPDLIKAMKTHTTVAENIRGNVDSIKADVDRMGADVERMGADVERIRVDVDRLIESDMKQEARLVTIELEQAKANIYNGGLPITERVWNAHRYLRCGGNSETAVYVRDEMAKWPEFAAVWKIADDTKGKVAL